MKRFYFALDSEFAGVLSDLKRHGHVVEFRRSGNWADLVLVDGVKRGEQSVGMYYGSDRWLDESLVSGRRFDFRRSRNLLPTEVHVINNRLRDKRDLDVGLLPEVERLYHVFVEKGWRRVNETSGTIFWLETTFPQRGGPNDEYVE